MCLHAFGQYFLLLLDRTLQIRKYVNLRWPGGWGDAHPQHVFPVFLGNGNSCPPN